MQEMKQKGSLTRIDAAAYLSVSLRTLDLYIQAGEIPRVKLGRKTVIRVVDLDKFLEGKIVK